MGKWRFNDPPRSVNAMLVELTLPRDSRWEETVLAVAWGGEANDRVLWKVIEAEHGGMTERWIECVEVDFTNNGWRLDTEAEGPSSSDCPLEFLAMVPERHPAWRERVRATEARSTAPAVWPHVFKNTEVRP